MIDWGMVGAAVAAFLAGTGWLKERKRRKSAERPEPPWDGETERRGVGGEVGTISGKWIVNRLEDDKAPIPRHWDDLVRGLVTHKVNGAMAAPLLRMDNLSDRVEALETSMGRRMEALEHLVDQKASDLGAGLGLLTKQMERIIGKFFPNDPMPRG